MRSSRRFLPGLLAIVLIVTTLVLPMAASAGRDITQRGLMYVPPFASHSYNLSVGNVSVSIPPGAMPWGGFVYLRVTEAPNGRFVAEFLPDRQFPVPVKMQFGSAPWVDYSSSGGPIRIWTVNGSIDSTHFSRYSGWF